MNEGLRRNGVEVIECHERLWHRIEDRLQTASRGWLRPAFVVRVAQAILTLKGDPDLRKALDHSGHKFFEKDLIVAALSKQFKHHLQTLTQSS